MIVLSKKIRVQALLIVMLAIPSLKIIGAESTPAKKGVKERIKNFFTKKKDSPQGTNSYVDDSKICPFCQEEWGTTEDGIEVKKTILKPCNHAVCEICATHWLKNNETCPVCQQKVEVSLMSRIRSKFNSLKIKIEKKFSNARAMLKDKWGNTKEKAKGTWQSVKGGVKNLFSSTNTRKPIKKEG